MAVYLTLTAAVAMLALLVREEKMPLMNQGVTRQQLVNRVSCLFIFCLLFAVSALRLNVGNDYLKYVEFMHLVFSRAYVPTEIGFNALSYAVYYLCGFENYLLVFAIFSFATIYFFMKGIYGKAQFLRYKRRILR